MSLQENLSYMINEIKNVPYMDHKGRKYRFTLSDLYRGYIWKNIELKERITLGTMFYDWAQNEGKEIVVPDGKTAQGQQIYRRV